MTAILRMYKMGSRDALAAHGIQVPRTGGPPRLPGAPVQPSPKQVGIPMPAAVGAPAGTPPAPSARPTTVPRLPKASPVGGAGGSGGTGASSSLSTMRTASEEILRKLSFNLGMGSSTSSDGAGAAQGEPAEEGRRQRSVVDRAFQRNEDDYATSSMPMPGGNVSP